MKGWEKTFHRNGNQKKTATKVAVVISDKIAFKSRAVITPKKGVT